ncbi:MAG TPA: homoserine kinase, partial [Limnochordia bacterium]|nr:homoserine kinase [Limnochordia bacterium]
LCSPAVELSTKAARAALPESVPHRDAVFNGAHAALLVAALTTGRYDVLRTAMADRLHQPYRAPLIPGLERALAAAGEAGACGACLSGAGPTALALCRDEATAERAAGLMQQAFAAAGLTSGARVVRPRARGAEVLV